VDTAPEIEAAPLEMAGRIAGDDESFAKILPSKNALAKNPAAAACAAYVKTSVNNERDRCLDGCVLAAKLRRLGTKSC
jgi:hypothetical protein